MINNQNLAVLSEKVAYLESAVQNSNEASEISYDNTESGLTADDVQDAIDELASASGISYDNTESGLTADDVQGAIDEVNGKISITKTAFVPNYGASEDLATRNFFVTDNATFLEVHYALRCQTAILASADLITLPAIAQNRITQYSIGLETLNNKAHVVYNSGNYIYLDGVDITADAAGFFVGELRISLLL